MGLVSKHRFDFYHTALAAAGGNSITTWSIMNTAPKMRLKIHSIANYFYVIDNTTNLLLPVIPSGPDTGISVIGLFQIKEYIGGVARPIGLLPDSVTLGGTGRDDAKGLFLPFQEERKFIDLIVGEGLQLILDVTNRNANIIYFNFSSWVQTESIDN
jgi:hypothetical protein